jgi:hypothetical protein
MQNMDGLQIEGQANGEGDQAEPEGENKVKVPQKQTSGNKVS